MLGSRWVVLLVGLLACGLLAAGCGDDSDDDSSDAATITAPPEPPNIPEDATAPVPETTTPSEDSTSTDIAGGIDTEAFQQDCIDAVGGATEGEALCQQAVDSFEQCAEAAATAGDAAAVQTCQQIADQALESLEGAGG